MEERTAVRSTARRGRRKPPAGEEGYVLLAAVFLMAVLVLALAIAAPKIARSIQRDRDLETFHRGMQYRRAVQLYYRKFHAYPPNVEALVQTNNIRFLRKRYKDPITGQDDWKPILFGQNKTPTAMGFFGQPLAGSASTLAGIGPSGGGAGLTNATGSAFGGSSFGGSSFGGSSFGGSSFGGGGTSSFGSTDSGSGGTTGTDTSGSGSSTSTGSTSSTGSSTPGSSSAFGGGQTFGGAGIIGFEPASPKTSILIYKKKQHYNEWEFTYDPLSEMKTISGNTGMIGQPASNTTNSPGSNNQGGFSLGNTGLNSGQQNSPQQ